MCVCVCKKEKAKMGMNLKYWILCLGGWGWLDFKLTDQGVSLGEFLNGGASRVVFQYVCVCV